MKVAVVKYNAGNIFSVMCALKRLGAEPVLTDDAAEIRSASHIVFPGQGEASGAMACLREKGLDTVLREATQPVLGICIGMQLLCSFSEEGSTPCLGIFPMEVKRFRPVRHEDKVPAMGWNSLHGLRGPLFKGIDEDSFTYFVHSFYVPASPFTIATADYVQPYSAAICRDNFFATQFHPEKSGVVGEQILRNFLAL
ncbi:MAG: imidazole glycerol phosphate synthase subunit HisH [Prevotella sp.]|nr:imidazole glycerol phosphate synthase subunit HisH [Prevotella sp.]